MSLQEALSGTSRALVMITRQPQEPQASTSGKDDSEPAPELLSRYNMDLIKTSQMSRDHSLLLQKCPKCADYSRVMIKKHMVSACSSAVAWSTLLENHQHYVVGRLAQTPVADLPGTRCTLSIRTMLGDTIKATFSPDESLSDVKRWLHSENNISFEPEEITTTGHFKPSRFAFFSPATRTTFTESQESMPLKDLDLCPRSALLLRPDFDESAMKAARAAESQSSLRSFWIKSKILLQALYQFFDYGVDDAHHDFQDMVEEIESEDSFGHYIFSAFAGPVPSARPLAPTTSVVDPQDRPLSAVVTGEKVVVQAQSKDALAQVYGEEAHSNI